MKASNAAMEMFKGTASLGESSQAITIKSRHSTNSAPALLLKVCLPGFPCASAHLVPVRERQVPHNVLGQQRQQLVVLHQPPQRTLVRTALHTIAVRNLLGTAHSGQQARLQQGQHRWRQALLKQLLLPRGGAAAAAGRVLLVLPLTVAQRERQRQQLRAVPAIQGGTQLQRSKQVEQGTAYQAGPGCSFNVASQMPAAAACMTNGVTKSGRCGHVLHSASQQRPPDPT